MLSVPPAIKQSQKLIRLPRVTYGKSIVCLSPTVWAPLAPSSRRHACLICAPEPMLELSRKVDPKKYPPLNSTFLPIWQLWTVAGVSYPSLAPDKIRVSDPYSLQPEWIVTLSPEILSGFMSSPISIPSGQGILTPFLSSRSFIFSINLPLI